MRHAPRSVFLLAGCLVTMLAMPSSGRADQILPINGGWKPFSWHAGVGSFDAEGAFTFTAPTAVTLKVTDTFFPGDRFAVFDNNVLLGQTGTFTPGGAWTPGPDSSYGSPFFSWAHFALAPGPHSIMIQTIEIPANNPEGVAFLRVDSRGDVVPVDHAPEPATLALAALGGALALGYRRWRRAL
jgi:hypothetical protein